MDNERESTQGSPGRVLHVDDGVIQPLPTPTIAHLGLEERIRFLLERMIDLVRCDEGIVLLLDEATGRLEPRARVGSDGADEPGNAYRLGDDLVEIVARDGSPAVIPDVRELADPERAHLSARGTRSLAALPLKAGGRILGVVEVRFRDRRDLDAPDIHRLTAIADHIAALAETARLYEESRARTAELERANEEMRQLDRLKGDFLALISHELRTPLTSIIGYTDLLLRQLHGPLNDRQEQHGLAVKKAAARLLALINDLLEVVRLQYGQVELTSGPTGLPDTFAGALSEFLAAAERGAVELRIDAPPALPTVWADNQRLHQILVHLLDNAIKFTPPGGTVTICAEPRVDSVYVCVIDTGVGVPAEELGRIWDRFHQVDSSTRRRFGGTGLGLAIVRDLVELQGGTVEARSDGPGQGSVFGFTVPLAPSNPRGAVKPFETPDHPVAKG